MTILQNLFQKLLNMRYTKPKIIYAKLFLKSIIKSLKSCYIKFYYYTKFFFKNLIYILISSYIQK